MAGAEAGKRNIPGSTACLRPIQEHMSSPQIEARLSHHTCLGLQHTRVSQGVAPYHQGRKSRAQSCHPLTAHGMWARLMALNLTLLVCDWLCPLHGLPNLLCADWRRGTG
jgi:hypothetical protein